MEESGRALTSGHWIVEKCAAFHSAIVKAVYLSTHYRPIFTQKVVREK